MYQDAIDMLSGLVKTTPGLKGITINEHGKISMNFKCKPIKVNNSIEMLDEIELRKKY